ncbi:MAG: hypothetical protein AAF253_03450, partial [Pseudomonadota bacterium]
KRLFRPLSNPHPAGGILRGMYTNPVLREAFDTVPVHRWPVLIWQILIVGIWLQQLVREGKPLPQLWVDVTGMIYRVPPQTHSLRDGTALPNPALRPDLTAISLNLPAGPTTASLTAEPSAFGADTAPQNPLATLAACAAASAIRACRLSASFSFQPHAHLAPP